MKILPVIFYRDKKIYNPIIRYIAQFDEIIICSTKKNKPILPDSMMEIENELMVAGTKKEDLSEKVVFVSILMDFEDHTKLMDYVFLHYILEKQRKMDKQRKPRYDTILWIHNNIKVKDIKGAIKSYQNNNQVIAGNKLTICGYRPYFNLRDEELITV